LTIGDGTTMVVTLTKNYTGYNDADTLPLEFDMADIYTSSGWKDSDQYWKVWNCLVNVSGTVYDGSAGQACNTIGFSQIAGNNLGFDQLIYKNMSSGADVVMGVAPPASYSGTDLIWSQSYLPIFNGGDVGNPDGDIAGSARFTRGIDLGIGTTHCADYLGGTSQFAVSNIISPYSTNTQAQIDFSYIRDQKSWFQVEGGGVKGRNEISSGVPVTAASNYLTIDNNGIGVSNNGIVASMTFRNSNGYNDSSQYGNPNNWRIADDVVGSNRYSYLYLYGQYFTKLGEGVTNTTIVGAGSTGVVFVSGNLTISSDVTVPVGKFLMVIASGSINVDAGVNQLDGIYIADGGINIGNNSNTQMVVNGILYSATTSNIRINRTFTVKEDNNTNPAVVVKYRPDFIFTMPGKLTKLLSGWREF